MQIDVLQKFCQQKWGGGGSFEEISNCQSSCTQHCSANNASRLPVIQLLKL